MATAVVCLALIGAPAASGQARLAPDELIPHAELDAFVDGVVHQSMAGGHIAGASVAVVQAGGIVLAKGYGFADFATGRRVDPETTLFRIGSITKTFTWIALMNAIDAGRLDLDGPINMYLPADLRIPDDGFTEPIRVRHLMTHSGGFEDRMFGHLFETNPSDVRALAAYLRQERPRRVREPGRVHSYSNYGVALTGAALEHITGRRWQDIVEAEILGPLVMSHTSVREPYPSRDDLPAPMPDDLATHLSKGYRWTGVGHESQAFEHITQIAPAGVISSTAGDMARYMLMLLNDGSLDGARVFGGAAARAFHTPMTSLPVLVGNWNGGFLQTQMPGGFQSIGHDGGSLLFFSSMVLVPELQLGIFVTTNTEGGDSLSGPFAARIIERFYAEPVRAPLAGARELVASAPVYDGYYLQTRRPYSGLQAFLFRLLARRARVTPDGYLTVALMGPPQRFVPGDEPEVFRSVDPEGFSQGIRFRREGDVATRIETSFMAFERVGTLGQPPILLLPAALAMLVSLGTLLGVRARFRRGSSQTSTEQLANTLQVLAATAWLISAAAVGLFAANATSNEATLLYDWPAVSIVVFSSAALAAGALAGGMLFLLPSLWRGAGGGWTMPRKLRYTATAIVFAAVSGILAWWGALQPWNA